MANVAKDLAQIISQSKNKKTGPYDTQAKVKRIEGNTVWVSIPGGIDETPIDKTVNCSVGDNVQVRVSGGRAWITGNATAPPTDDTTAIKADTTANKAQVIAVDAKETAEAVEGIAVNASTTATTAKTIAEGVNEHFWHDSGGAHVTEVTQEEWNDPADPNYHFGGNTLITTQGMAIRNGLTPLAQFGSTGAVIGKNANGESRSEISTSGMQIIQNVSGVDTAIANLGYGPGTDSGGGTSDAPYYTLGVRIGTVGNYSVAEGENSESSGYASHCEGYNCVASGGFSHAEGDSAEAHEGAAHAEGTGSIASERFAHAQNLETIANQWAQTTLGTYNIADTTPLTPVHPNGYTEFGNYAVIVGNGTDDNARSNALTVDWSGNVALAGAVQSFFKIVELAVETTASIAAHSYQSNATYTVAAGDRPSGMTLVGIVGWAASNFRLYASTAYVNGTHSISVTIGNSSATSVAAGATINFRLLYAKVTSA